MFLTLWFGKFILNIIGLISGFSRLLDAPCCSGLRQHQEVFWQNRTTTEVYKRAGMSWQGNQIQQREQSSQQKDGASFRVVVRAARLSSQPADLRAAGTQRPWSHYNSNTRGCPTSVVTPQHTKTHCKQLQTGWLTQAHLPEHQTFHD